MKRAMMVVILCALGIGLAGCQCPFGICGKKCDGKQKTEECDKSAKVCEGCGNAMAECTCEKAETE